MAVQQLTPVSWATLSVDHSQGRVKQMVLVGLALTLHVVSLHVIRNADDEIKDVIIWTAPVPFIIKLFEYVLIWQTFSTTKSPVLITFLYSQNYS